MGETFKLPTATEALRRAWAEMITPDGEAFRASVFIDIARELREGTAVSADVTKLRDAFEVVATSRGVWKERAAAAGWKASDEPLPGAEAAEANARKVVELETELGELRAKLRSRERSDDVRRNEGSLPPAPPAELRDPKLWTAVAEPGERFPAPDQTARMPRDFFAEFTPVERPQIPMPVQRPLPAEVAASIKAQLAQPIPYAPQPGTTERGECLFCGGGIYAATVHQDGSALKSWRHRETGLVICPPNEGDEAGTTQYATPAP